MTKTFNVAVLFAIAAGLASAQNFTYNFAGPTGLINCSRVQPYQQHYQNLVENSIPPYPNPLPPDNFLMSPFPNHPYPVIDGGCPNMGGFVSASGATATLQLGQSGGWMRIFKGSVAQSVQIGQPVWTGPSTYPAEGESVEFSMNAPILAVCNAECTNASGNLHFSGHFHFIWAHTVVYRWNEIFKQWTDDDAEFDGQSTAAILD